MIFFEAVSGLENFVSDHAKCVGSSTLAVRPTFKLLTPSLIPAHSYELRLLSTVFTGLLHFRFWLVQVGYAYRGLEFEIDVDVILRVRLCHRSAWAGLAWMFDLRTERGSRRDFDEERVTVGDACRF